MFRRIAAAATATVAAAALVAGSGTAWAGTSITGPDVSSYQHPNTAPINWSSVRSSGATFAFIKATEGPSSSGGSYYTNPYFAQDWAGATAAGLDVGAYHYAHPGATSAQAQASYFVSVAGSMQGQADLPPVLDLEDSGGLSPSALVSWVQAWMNEVQALTGRVGIIYTYPSFYNSAIGSAGAALAAYPLWLASYTGGSSPGTIGSWGTFTFWQYTDQASVNGISGPVDDSQFCCTVTNLDDYLGGTNPAASNPFGVFDTIAAVTGTTATAASSTSSSSTTTSTTSTTSTSSSSSTAASTATSSSSSSSSTTTTASTGPGAQVRGWAIDPDTTQPIQVAISVDGAPATTATADQPSPDVQNVYPGFGPDHRFDVFVPIANGGPHTVCISALNVGYGTGATSLGCKSVTLPPTPPSAPVATAARYVGPNGVVVNWQAPTQTNGAPVSSYLLAATPQSTAGGSQSPQAVSMQVPPASGTATSALLTNLGTGVPYQISIAATNSAGTGPTGNTVTVTPPAAGSTSSVCTGNEPNPFSDVTSADVHMADIDCMAAHKIVQGTTSGLYNPRGALTREQMASLLVHLLSGAGLHLANPTSFPFTDVPADDVHATAIAQLAELGVTTGVTASTFDPDAVVTRAQMASFLARSFAAAATTLPAGTTDPFSDVPAGAPHATDILAVAAAGIALGSDGAYNPGLPVYRDQVASFLARTLNLLAQVRTVPATATQ